MSCAGSHWGEEHESQRSGSDEWGLSNSDMEDLLTPQPPAPTSPVLHQPSQEETPSFQILPAEFCRTDPMVLQTIRLLQYQRQVAQLLNRAQSIGMDGGGLPSCPPPPEDPPLERKTTKPHFLNFIPPEHTPFTSGKNQPQLLEVEGTTARLILRKAVATICAHTGYTDTAESVLRLLTDVTHEFLTKLTNVLRANADNLLLTDRCPFHDVVEQTLHDIGMGSMNELHQMYRDRVVLYHARVRQESLQLYHQYMTVLHNREASIATPGYVQDKKKKNVISILQSSCTGQDERAPVSGGLMSVGVSTVDLEVLQLQAWMKHLSPPLKAHQVLIQSCLSILSLYLVRSVVMVKMLCRTPQLLLCSSISSTLSHQDKFSFLYYLLNAS
ncbi:hypothetical protein OTU49_008335 [Cherax quadricarinatus]|uniref:Bromodomain associated domain-containing protein n=1 Tax=Cherax quadricarinatus TaxID=27406 RepID=A0AAW0WCI6_CHEQU